MSHAYFPVGFLGKYLIEECLDCQALKFYAKDDYEFRRALWEAMQDGFFETPRRDPMKWRFSRRVVQHPQSL